MDGAQPIAPPPVQEPRCPGVAGAGTRGWAHPRPRGDGKMRFFAPARRGAREAAAFHSGQVRRRRAPPRASNLSMETAMDRAQKQEAIDTLKGVFDAAGTVVVTHY